jgi:hypothetical protein
MSSSASTPTRSASTSSSPQPSDGAPVHTPDRSRTGPLRSVHAALPPAWGRSAARRAKGNLGDHVVEP